MSDSQSDLTYNIQMTSGTNEPAPNSHAPDIVEVTTESFMHDVIEASKRQLVLLDLWAPWCEPCKQLTPLLEKATRESNGAIRLAKMNIDAHPQVAQQMQVQSIPAVFAFKDGRPVDAFMGLISAAQLKEFIETKLDTALPPSPLEEKFTAATAAVERGEIIEAANQFAAILQAEPVHIGAIAGLAQCHILADNLDQAEQVLQLAPINNVDPVLEAARAKLALARKTAENKNNDGDDTRATLQAQLQKNPQDFQARFDLALAHHGAGQKNEAIDELLTLIEQKRDWNDDAARKQLVEFFTAYGPTDPLTIEGRRRLSSVLFK